ncbi:zinc finger protein ZAT9-like [Solanum dulcamara]|uniref:zinc finger protein ZAT9-like n=1 Tax=Solanum dulcamara TaxID=45834 RepID=UPI0024852054|nr:zinc finger protein ZAT9-like [Solanum dulcamara]
MEAQDDQENNGSCSKGPPSSSNFKLKLKIAKLMMKDEDESRGDEGVKGKNFLVKQKKDHICCECGKEFSSGKALGGHMSSAHVQANQRLEESWKKKKNFTQEKSSRLIKRRFDDEEILEEEEEIGDGVFNKIICEICFKSFPSKKSLFGHMRCHPDRDWRGMKPPFKKNTKNEGFQANFLDEEDVDDEDRFASIRDEEVVPPLKGWGAKDRRGRSPKRSLSSTNSDEDKDLHDAVQQLIRLVNGDENNNNNNNNNSSEVMMGSSNSVGSSASKETPFSDLKDKSKRKMVVDEENCEETSLVQEKRKRENEEVKYKCNVCGKIFASHQALGGHRSSHNKFKISIENTIDHPHHQDQEIKARNQEDHGHQDVVQLGNQEINNCNIIINDQHGSNNNHHNNVYKCKFCDKIFPTGQALGGHQRSHMTNNQEESSSQIASKVLDFDLNELPDLDDDRLL